MLKVVFFNINVLLLFILYCNSGGQMSGFVSGKSLMGEERSQSSTTPQPGWFIEPYER